MSAKQIKIGKVYIGGGAPIAIQSMTNTDTKNETATINQINQLQNSGCDIVRLSVYDMDCIAPLKNIIKNVDVPLVADIHFDYKLAIASIEAGVSKLRINPGNIGSDDKIIALARCAKEYGVPIRVGANSGSLPKDLIDKYNGVNESSIVESALRHVKLLEQNNFYDIVISVKSSNVPLMIRSYKLLSTKCNYPLHLGVTEAGTYINSIVKSSIGIGSLLNENIGDTIRVSITGDPINEANIAKKILKSIGKLDSGIEIISCPTCARTCLDVEEISDIVEIKFTDIKKPLKIAVMGCVVNGPGEAKEADIGIAGGKSGFVIFKDGQVLRTVNSTDKQDAINALTLEIQNLL